MHSVQALDSLIADLASIADERDRQEFIAREPLLRSRDGMDALHAGVIRLAYSDVAQAARLEQAARILAEQINDDYSHAFSARCSGHLHYVGAQYESAVSAYQTSLEIFARLGLEIQSARTQSSGIQALIYLGRYEQALEWADSARRVFEAHQDKLRLARLDSNVANILLRQDRYDEAIEIYQRAYKVLAEVGEPRDLAAVLSNIAVCYMSMSRFGKALEVFREARVICGKNGLSKLVAEADYNIAWIHYLRGEYRTAIELYQTTRRYCEETGDAYHASLCDLDEAELFLDLNLNREGEQLARRAAREFRRLGMRYERAKALVNTALACVDAGHSRRAMLMFRQARRLFLEDRNYVWAAVIDLYRAVVCHRAKKNKAAKRYCGRAEKVLAGSALTGKAVLCDLLKAQIYREEGHRNKARRIVLEAKRHLDNLGIRSLALHASFLLAQLEEEAGNVVAAYEACQFARREIEALRSRLWGEDIQVSFLKDKLSLYEMLVRLCMNRSEPEAHEEAFRYIEEAKSRSLAESLTLQAREDSQQGARIHAAEVQELRRELQGLYRQIERVSFDPEHPTQLRSLRGEANRCEEKLASSIRELGRTDRESAALLGGSPISLEEIRTCVPADAVLLQFYAAGETLYCALLSRTRLQIVPVAATKETRKALHLFRFQMSKVRLGPAYLKNFFEVWYRATRNHLENLYIQLISPIRHLLDCRHLIIAPYGGLHHLPFHALLRGDRYLMDDYTISYSPNASVFGLCSDRPPSSFEESLVFGIPDSHTPEITGEVAEIAEILPKAHLFVGESATLTTLRNYAVKSRFVHLATHGLFRSDNPLFSSIQLGDSRVSLLDLYDFQMPADLVTLSGCSTGMNEVVGGDELIGLVRGLLYAGARSLLVSLWEVNDKSTSCFMKSFYANIVHGGEKASALQSAMHATREEYPHPYHWAPFVMVGKYQI